MINHINANYLTNTSAKGEITFNNNTSNLLIESSNSINSNPYLTKIDDTMIRNYSQYPLISSVNPNNYNILSNQLHQNTHNNTTSNNIIYNNTSNSNDIAPLNGMDHDRVIDPNLLFHCELALKKHFNSIINEQHMQYSSIDINNLIHETTSSDNLTQYLIALIQKSSYFNRLMILLHTNTKYTTEEVQHMEKLQLSLNNKIKFKKGEKADDEFKAINKIKSEFYCIIRQVMSKSGFFDKNPNNIFLQYDCKKECVSSIANLLFTVIFNKRESADQKLIIKTKG